MQDTQPTTDELARLAAEWRERAARGSAPEALAREYRTRLERLYSTGWDDALGESAELPDEQMPERYLRRRELLLRQLEDRLGELATEYRRSDEGSETEQRVLRQYASTMDEMFRIGHWSGNTDPDNQLPADLMPASYKEFKERRRRERRQRRTEEAT